MAKINARHPSVVTLSFLSMAASHSQTLACSVPEYRRGWQAEEAGSVVRPSPHRPYERYRQLLHGRCSATHAWSHPDAPRTSWGASGPWSVDAVGGDQSIAATASTASTVELVVESKPVT